MSTWHEIGPLDKFSDGNQWLIQIDERPVALFKYNNDFYALKNGCLHQGFPLAEGHMKSYMVECPLHGWVYDIRDGKCLSLENRYTIKYDLRIRNKILEINMN